MTNALEIVAILGHAPRRRLCDSVHSTMLIARLKVSKGTEEWARSRGRALSWPPGLSGTDPSFTVGRAIASLALSSIDEPLIVTERSSAAETVGERCARAVP
jgi:hypothetical protein